MANGDIIETTLLTHFKFAALALAPLVIFAAIVDSYFGASHLFAAAITATMIDSCNAHRNVFCEHIKFYRKGL